jgi:hypothetical protein
MNRLNYVLAVAIVASIVALAVALFVGCATTDPPTVINGCAIDAKKACTWMLDNDQIVSEDGLTLTRQRMQNISVRHIEVVAWSAASGAQLRCVVDSQNARISDGHLSGGPQLNDADIAWFREKGLCQ